MLHKDDAAIPDATDFSPDSACTPKRAAEFAKEKGLPRLNASNARAYPPRGIKLTACIYRDHRGADGVYDVASDSRAALWYWQVRAAHEQPPSRLMSSSSAALADDGLRMGPHVGIAHQSEAPLLQTVAKGHDASRAAEEGGS